VIDGMTRPPNATTASVAQLAALDQHRARRRMITP